MIMFEILYRLSGSKSTYFVIAYTKKEAEKYLLKIHPLADIIETKVSEINKKETK